MQCKKAFAIVLLFLATFFTAIAQTPESFSYQAVARNSESGSELANAQLQVLVQIRKNSPQGEIVYQEDHFDVATNGYGLFTLKIGTGSATSPNTLGEVAWSTGNYWLTIEIDAGEGFTAVSSTQLLAVPYALHALSADNINDADADPSNELIDQFTFNEGLITIGEQGNISTLDLSSVLISDAYLDNAILYLSFLNLSTQPVAIDLSELINDADADPVNELIEDVFLSTTTLHLLEGGAEYEVDLSSLKIEQAVLDSDGVLHLSLADGVGELSVDLSGLVNDADANPANELNISVSFNNSTRTFSITDAGGSKTVVIPDAVDDADADPENELIQNFELASDTALVISEGANSHTVDMKAFMDSKWKRTPGEEVVFNINDKVGIGVEIPQARLQVNGVNEAAGDPLFKTVTTTGEVAAVVTNNKKMGIAEPNPTSTLHVMGSMAGNVQHRFFGEGNYALANDDFLVAIELEGTETPGSQIAVNLPLAATCQGRIYHIKRYGTIPGNDNYINVQTSGSDVIDGNLNSIQLNENNPEILSFISAGAHGWIIIGFMEF